MASTNHTGNYNLPQWAATDPFKREDFNDAFAKIDTAIKGNADGVAAAAKIVFGSYVGDDSYGSSHPTKLEFETVPKLVSIFLASDGATNTSYIYANFMPTVCPTGSYPVEISGGKRNLQISWSADKKRLQWYTNETANSSTYQLNRGGIRYHYYLVY